ncbi:unnamed protein product [Vicia faba]|uniref:Uncharacterized protein n=1 Tax=Vicia faba TaxID=3906 RepID=A0AAV1ABB3_VICFA|nr:unnamed protein product [Vicia faba]
MGEMIMEVRSACWYQGTRERFTSIVASTVAPTEVLQIMIGESEASSDQYSGEFIVTDLPLEFFCEVLNRDFLWSFLVILQVMKNGEEEGEKIRESLMVILQRMKN